MARKCFMCGREVTQGILCEKCDKPRRRQGDLRDERSDPEGAAESRAPEPRGPEVRPPESRPPEVQQSREATAPAIDPFPKAPIVPFPVESTSPAITSIVNLLVAAGVPSVLVGPDRRVKFVSDDAAQLFDTTAAELSNFATIEARSGVRVGELSVPVSAGARIGNRNVIYTLVPISGGAGGAVVLFRNADPMNETHASFITYVRETVLGPLRALGESLDAAATARGDHFLADSAATIEQVLSSLELAPGVEEASSTARPVPKAIDVVRRVADRFRAHADLKGIRLDVDVQDMAEQFADHDALADALTILMENALHYVPAAGQVVIGARWMEHKSKPLLLFFVMDNGPVVPEELRQAIFEPSFVWNAAAPERTGRGLFRCREFAVAHAGSVWVESKTGKACTFFLRVRPDGVR